MQHENARQTAPLFEERGQLVSFHVDISERERDGRGHVLDEGGPATTRVFLLPRGDARQKCNRWCGATRCNYWGNSRHAGFDAGHPDARRRYAVPLHENNPSVPSVEGGAAEIPAGYEGPSPSLPKSVCLRQMCVRIRPFRRWINRSMERSSDNPRLQCLQVFSERN